MAVTSARPCRGTPRRYKTERGVRLNVHAIARRFGTTPGSFHTLNARGWPALNGRSLESQLMRYGRGRGEVEGTWLDEEVAEAMSKPTYPLSAGAGRWLSEGIYEENRKRFFTGREILRLYHFLRHTHLLRWQCQCRFLPDGRAIEIRKPTPPPTVRTPHNSITVFFEKDVLLIVGAMRKRDERTVVRDGLTYASGETFLRALRGAADKERLRQWKENPQSLRDWFHFWTNRSSRLREGDVALRSILHVKSHPGKGSRIESSLYCVEDAKAIILGKEDETPAIEKAGIFLADLLKTRPLSSNEAKRAARQEGFTDDQIKKGKVRAGILSTPVRTGAGLKSWWHLPGQEPPGETFMPSSAGEAVLKILRHHEPMTLEQLASKSGEPRPTWYQRLRVLREAGLVVPRKVSQPGKPRNPPHEWMLSNSVPTIAPSVNSITTGEEITKEGTKVDPGCKYMQKLDRIEGNTERIEKILRETPQQTAELIHQRIRETATATESPTDARGRWIYEQRLAGKSWRAIVYEVNLSAEKCGWEPFGGQLENQRSQASSALGRWCKKHRKKKP